MNTAPTTTRDNVRHQHATVTPGQRVPLPGAYINGTSRPRRVAADRRWYTSGWRWGFLDGLCCGGVLVCVAMALGHWIGIVR